MSVAFRSAKVPAGQRGVTAELFREDYHDTRPLSSLGQLPPSTYAEMVLLASVS